uniref:Uncharacterized protein n=1 Tax=Oryza glumipatula TaxID=40148 RepID=A0A0E0B193_9ORYZ
MQSASILGLPSPSSICSPWSLAFEAGLGVEHAVPPLFKAHQLLQPLAPSIANTRSVSDYLLATALEGQGAFDVGSSSSPSSPFPACTPASPAMPSLAPTSGKDDLNFVLFSVQSPFKIFQLVRMDREFRMVVGNLLQINDAWQGQSANEVLKWIN